MGITQRRYHFCVKPPTEFNMNKNRMYSIPCSCGKVYIDLVGRVSANGLGDLGSIPGRIIPKTLKWYLIPPCLTFSNIRYVPYKSGAIHGKEYHPPLHLGVVAIEKGAFWSPSTMVDNYTFYLLYIGKTWCSLKLRLEEH